MTSRNIRRTPRLALFSALLCSAFALSLSGTALARSQAATGITAHSAILRGTFSCRGGRPIRCSYYFRYGTSSHSFPRATKASRPTAAHVRSRTVTALITGLRPATTYYYEFCFRGDAVARVRCVREPTFRTSELRPYYWAYVGGCGGNPNESCGAQDTAPTKGPLGGNPWSENHPDGPFEEGQGHVSQCGYAAYPCTVSGGTFSGATGFYRCPNYRNPCVGPLWVLPCGLAGPGRVTAPCSPFSSSAFGDPTLRMSLQQNVERDTATAGSTWFGYACLIFAIPGSGHAQILLCQETWSSRANSQPQTAGTGWMFGEPQCEAWGGMRAGGRYASSLNPETVGNPYGNHTYTWTVTPEQFTAALSDLDRACHLGLASESGEFDPSSWQLMGIKVGFQGQTNNGADPAPSLSYAMSHLVVETDH